VLQGSFPSLLCMPVDNFTNTPLHPASFLPASCLELHAVRSYYRPAAYLTRTSVFAVVLMNKINLNRRLGPQERRSEVLAAAYLKMNTARRITSLHIRDKKNFITNTISTGIVVSNTVRLSLLALRLAVREMGFPLLPILHQNPRLVPRIIY